MTKYITFASLIFTVFMVDAQIAIGKETINGNSTILDFNNVSGNNKGLILPAVDAEPIFTITPNISSVNNGTFIFDKTEKKVKMFENNDWVDLTSAGNDSQIVVNPSAESSSQQGVIIGSDNSAATGVLILESADKAMILPQIANPHTAVQGPYAGMICYDTVSKSLAVFDGVLWHYWK